MMAGTAMRGGRAHPVQILGGAMPPQAGVTWHASLRRTRDLLLPKLISGEIDVSNLDMS